VRETLNSQSDGWSLVSSNWSLVSEWTHWTLLGWAMEYYT